MTELTVLSPDDERIPYAIAPLDDELTAWTVVDPAAEIRIAPKQGTWCLPAATLVMGSLEAGLAQPEQFEWVAL